MKKLFLLLSLAIILCFACGKTKNHCYNCVVVDSVFNTGFPDTINYSLIRVDSSSGKNCFESAVKTKDFVRQYWEARSPRILFHKIYYNCK